MNREIRTPNRAISLLSSPALPAVAAQLAKSFLDLPIRSPRGTISGSAFSPSDFNGHMVLPDLVRPPHERGINASNSAASAIAGHVAAGCLSRLRTHPQRTRARPALVDPDSVSACMCTLPQAPCERENPGHSHFAGTLIIGIVLVYATIPSGRETAAYSIQ